MRAWESSQKVTEGDGMRWKIMEPCGFPRNWDIPRAGMHWKVPEGWVGWIRKVLEGHRSGWKVLEGLRRSPDPHLACGKAPAQPHVISIKAGPLWPGEGTSLPSAEDCLCCTGFPGVPRYWCLVQLSRFLGSLSSCLSGSGSAAIRLILL